MIMMIDWWIIEKSIEGRLAGEDEKRLQAWLKESPEHARFYERVKRAKEQGFPKADYAAWREAFVHRLQQRRRQRQMRQWRVWGSVAAVLVLGIAGGWWAWQMQTSQQTAKPVHVAYQQPDRNRVHIITAAGEVMNLSSSTLKDTIEIDGQAVLWDKKGLVYRKDTCAGDTSTLKMNEIYIPRGAEFQLTLADGSRIFLNSDTRLRYPSQFRGKQRIVELSGEAFFDINRKEDMPFVVQVDGMEVTVLGTEFNMNTRKPEKIQTTLVNGKVEVNFEGKTPVVLHPGEMASANTASGEIKAAKVNVQRYIAWRYGNFSFEEATMEEIMGELSLWYDVEVQFADERLKQERFSGYLPRSKSVNDILNKIEQTNYVHFYITGNRIIVGY